MPDRSNHPIRTVLRADLDVIMCHMVRCEEVCQQFSAQLCLNDFDEGYERNYQLLFAIIQRYWTQFQKPITWTALNAEIINRTQGVPEYEDIVQSIIHQAYSYFVPRPEDLCSEYAISVAEDFLYQRRVAAKMVTAVEQYGMYNMPRTIVDELNKQQQTVLSCRDIVPVNPFETLLLGMPPRIKLGERVLFLESLLGGGVRSGAMYGFIAPSGGGKTTLSHQLAFSFASLANHTVVFTYEQPITAEYIMGLYATAGQIDRKELEALRPGEQLSQVSHVKLVKAGETCAKYLHYVDMSGIRNTAGAGGPPEIDAILLSMERKYGISIGAYILDWFWPMCVRYYANYNVGYGKKQELRHFAQDMTYQLRQVAERHSCWCWINQQVAPDVAARKKEVDFEDAAELKSFAWYMDGCFALGKLDADKYGVLKYGKGRFDKVDRQVIQLKGHLSTFIPASEDMVLDELQGQHVARGRQNRVPINGEDSSRSLRIADLEGRE